LCEGFLYFFFLLFYHRLDDNVIDSNEFNLVKDFLLCAVADREHRDYSSDSENDTQCC
jgi:hypothetical protein